VSRDALKEAWVVHRRQPIALRAITRLLVSELEVVDQVGVRG
jgi:hypothetical protein